MANTLFQGFMPVRPYLIIPYDLSTRPHRVLHLICLEILYVNSDYEKWNGN